MYLIINYFQVKAYLSYIKTEKYCYAADPVDHKKLTFDQSGGQNGIWRNEATGAEYEKPNYKYCLQIKVDDYTGGKYAIAFNKEDQAQVIVGYTANELKEMDTNAGDHEVTCARVAEILEVAHYKQFKFVLMVKTDSYQEETRKQIQVFRCTKIDYAAENAKLIEGIEQYTM